MRPTLSSNNGAILLMTLMFLIVLTVLAMAFLKNVMYTGKSSSGNIDNANAFYIAEAGLNKAEWYLLNTAPNGTTNQTWRTNAYSGGTPNNAPSTACSGTTPCKEAFNNGFYTMWVETVASDVQITSCGLYNGISRTIQAKLYLATAPNNFYTAYPVAGSWTELSGVTKGACP